MPFLSVREGIDPYPSSVLVTNALCWNRNHLGHITPLGGDLSSIDDPWWYLWQPTWGELIMFYRY